MKKLLTTALALFMVFGLSASVLAADYDIPVDGYIGLDEDTDIEDILDLVVPTKFEWRVDEDSAPNVKASNYKIVNKKTHADFEIEVTLTNFEQTDSTVLPGTLTLNLTGALNEGSIGSDLHGGYTGSTAYSAKLMPAVDENDANAWTFSFGGTYVGSIPATPLKPEYKMELTFTVLSVSNIK